MILRNGTIFDAVHPESYVADIAVRNGKIAAIGANLAAEDGEQVINAAGKNIYPGLIDAHSHLGLDNYGVGWEGHDYNEMGDILSPQLRGIDGFNPLERGVRMALEGGVTVVGTGPGSANVLGGTFFAVKTHGKCVDEMILRDAVAMKCAFGENPKRCYKDNACVKHKMSSSFAGEKKVVINDKTESAYNDKCHNRKVDKWVVIECCERREG